SVIYTCVIHRDTYAFPTRRSSDLRRRKAVEQAADGGTDDGRKLPCRGRQRDGTGEVFLRHKIGDQRLARGIHEGARDAEDAEHRSEEHTSELQSRENLV